MATCDFPGGGQESGPPACPPLDPHMFGDFKVPLIWDS